MKDVDLKDILQRWLRGAMEGVHTAIPASIVSYSGHAKREAVVQPLVHFRGRDGFIVPYGKVSGVPVMFPGTARASMVYDLAKGDTGLLLVTECGIGNWLASTGEATEPEDASRFTMQDAVFIPGLFPFGAVPAVGAPDSGMWLNYQGTTMEFKKDGGLKITGNVEIMGDTTITGATSIEGDTTITGATSIEGDVAITGATEVDGDVSATGEVMALALVPATAIHLSTHMHPTAALGPASPPIPGT